MKTIELSDANDSLAEYARGASKQSLIVTKNGKPVAALVAVSADDVESLALSESKKLATILNKSRKSLKTHGGYSTAEVREIFGIGKRVSGK